MPGGPKSRTMRWAAGRRSVGSTSSESFAVTSSMMKRFVATPDGHVLALITPKVAPGHRETTAPAEIDRRHLPAQSRRCRMTAMTSRVCTRTVGSSSPGAPSLAWKTGRRWSARITCRPSPRNPRKQSEEIAAVAGKRKSRSPFTSLSASGIAPTALMPNTTKGAKPDVYSVPTSPSIPVEGRASRRRRAFG